MSVVNERMGDAESQSRLDHHVQGGQAAGMNEGMNERMNEWIFIRTPIHACLSVSDSVCNVDA